MRQLPTVFRSLTVLVVFLFVGCGGGGKAESPANGSASRASHEPSGAGACALLLQGEVDELFSGPVGAGLDEDLGEGTRLCTWPAAGEPRLLLQVGPASDDLRVAVDLGDGYRVSELSTVAGPAAIAVMDPSGDEPPSVTVLAVTSGEKTLVVSPIGLDVPEASPGFERFKAIVSAAAGRL